MRFTLYLMVFLVVSSCTQEQTKLEKRAADKTREILHSLIDGDSTRVLNELDEPYKTSKRKTLQIDMNKVRLYINKEKTEEVNIFVDINRERLSGPIVAKMNYPEKAEKYITVTVYYYWLENDHMKLRTFEIEELPLSSKIVL